VVTRDGGLDFTVWRSGWWLGRWTACKQAWKKVGKMAREKKLEKVCDDIYVDATEVPCSSISDHPTVQNISRYPVPPLPTNCTNWYPGMRKMNR
jgi:hypothetical protein